MKREIKYRAWSNNQTNSAVGPLMLEWDFVKSIPPGQWPERWEVMEFTGLLDRNDIEIYEGDILRTRLFLTDAAPTGDYEVCWFNHPGVLGINGYGINHYDEVEVIGNIFENPGLLGNDSQCVARVNAVSMNSVSNADPTR